MLFLLERSQLMGVFGACAAGGGEEEEVGDECVAWQGRYQTP